MRSLLFTPGDSARKMAKGAAGAADALILDLEDSVAEPNKPAARELVRAHLFAHAERTRQQLWVRINPLFSPHALDDLAAVVPGQPDGIMIPKVDGAADVTTLSNYLDAFETAFGIPCGTIGILAVATETPRALFALGGYAGSSPRLRALTWGAEDLAAALGACANRDAEGRLALTYQLARSLCLAGAVSANVLPIETLHPDFRDRTGLEAFAAQARRDGFVGMIAIHPDQVETINAAFTPTEAEIARAERIVAAFQQAGTGTVGLDGQMLDLPHLKQAQRLLAALPSIPARTQDPSPEHNQPQGILR
jgi:citrate lyase subunit beta/citryl-CoA lyase